jgi:hypothetical protein
MLRLTTSGDGAASFTPSHLLTVQRSYMVLIFSTQVVFDGVWFKSFKPFESLLSLPASRLCLNVILSPEAKDLVLVSDWKCEILRWRSE